MRTRLLPLLFLTTALHAQVVITQSGQWTVPPGVDTITVELIGPGGNGGTNGGGGGGGGGYARRSYAVSDGTTYSIVIGAGGSGQATTVGGLGMLALAGANGTSVPNPTIGGGGAGGSGLGGEVAYTGGNGGGGYWTYFGGGGGGAAGPSAAGGAGGNTIAWTGQCLTPGGAGGSSSGGPFGSGGKGAGFTDGNCTVSNPAADGGNYGAGGGGGNGIGSPVGLGAGGACIISWNAASALAPEATQGSCTLRTTGTSVFVDLPATSTAATITVHDAMGRTVWSGVARGTTHELPLPVGGAYVVRMNADGRTCTQRVVVE